MSKVTRVLDIFCDLIRGINLDKKELAKRYQIIITMLNKELKEIEFFPIISLILKLI